MEFAFLAFCFFFMFVVLAFVLLRYLTGSIGLYNMANREGKEEDAWMAWVPVLKLYLLGEITGDEIWGIQGSKWILPIMGSIVFILNLTGFGLFTFMYLGIVYFVFYYGVLYKLYKMYAPSITPVLLFVSICLPGLINFLIYFVQRNNKREESAAIDSASSEFDFCEQQKQYRQNFQALTNKTYLDFQDRKRLTVPDKRGEYYERAYLSDEIYDSYSSEIDYISSSIRDYMDITKCSSFLNDD